MSLLHTLPTTPLKHPAMDYTFLRQEGMHYLERLAKQLWTDFNAHDPGITILEQVCYALTDLAHRINYPLPDLLSSFGANPYESLYGPAQIFPSYPVTITDLRKFIIGIEGVKNAWIEQIGEQNTPLHFNANEAELGFQGDTDPVYLKGLYLVFLEVSDLLHIDGTEEDKDIVLKQIREHLHIHQGLGEAFETVEWLALEEIQVHAQIEIESLDNADKVLLEIYQRLADYISPPIRFSNLNEQLQAGKGIDEIFDGPFLEQGFIDSKLLKQTQRRTALRTSDLIHEIMDVPGVKMVRDISLSTEVSKESWSLNLDPNKVPRLDLNNSIIHLKRNQLAVNVDVDAVRKAYYRQLRELERVSKKGFHAFELQPPTGQDRNIEHYYSIQHQFPATYGIGAIGLPDSASPLRKAQAKQLQAYLLFFEQLLANDFAQLAHVKDLFSFTEEVTAPTYFSQAIADSTLGIDDIRSTDLATHEDRLKHITEEVTDFDRRNRFLNHLLARFSEQFTDYSLVLENSASAKLAQDKQAFLRDYPQLSQARGTVAGLEKRLRRKLGIVEEAKRFYIVEHILLRPIKEDEQQQVPFLEKPQHSDPFSLQISFIFPSEPFDDNFKTFIEHTLREETPAHLNFKLNWLKQEDMITFANAYAHWLEKKEQYWREKQIQQQTNPNINIIYLQFRDARDRLIDLLGLGQTYPLRDLKVSETLTVAFNTSAKILIENSQLGVLYQLYEKSTEVGEGVEPIDEIWGTGDTIILETYKIQEDITFKILAIKKNPLDPAIEVKTYLRQAVAVKVGLNTTLTAWIQDLDLLDPTIENPPLNTPRITNYNTQVTVEIENSQEGVDYQLVSKGGEILSVEDVRGDLHNIVLQTQHITEDIDIYIKATKTFDPSENRETQTALLDTILPLKVRANPDLSISITATIIDYQTGSTTLQIADTQASSTYQVYIRSIPDPEFIHGTPTPGTEVMTVAVPNEPDAQILKPDWNLIWETPEGYTVRGNSQVGTGEVIQFTLDSLTEDQVIIVQAQKEHQADVGKIVPSKVQLKQATVVLVRPNPAPSLSITILENTETGSRLQVSGGQLGVFYYLRLKSNEADLGLPTYFHKPDKGLERLKIEVDYVITGPQPETLEAPIVEASPLPSGTTQLYAYAVKAQTRVGIFLTDAVQL